MPSAAKIIVNDKPTVTANQCQLYSFKSKEDLVGAVGIAVVALQNARLYERAEIYASELELRLEELKQTQKALEDSESRSRTTNCD